MSNKAKRQQQRKHEAKRRQQRMVVITLVVLAAVGVGGFLIWNGGGGGATTSADAFQLERQPFVGDPSAPITLVEFVDFKCPHCMAFSAQVLLPLEEAYVKSGKVKIAVINFPFIGPDSRTAAIATEVVYQMDPEAFWPFVKAVFARQGGMSEIWATPELLTQLATDVSPKIDPEAFREALNDRRYAEEIEVDLGIVRKLGVQGTPTVYINGERVDELSYPSIKRMIDAKLAEAGV